MEASTRTSEADPVIDLTHLRRQLVTRMVVASACTSAGFITYFQLIGRLSAGSSRVLVVLQNVVIAVVATAIFAAIAWTWLRRQLQLDWQAAVDGSATQAQLERLLRHPMHAAVFVVVTWAFVAVAAPMDDLLSGSFKAAFAEFVGIMLGSFANAAVVYLLTERVLRPLFVIALAPRSTRLIVPGVRQRFLVAWALGSAVPFAAIAATPPARTGSIAATIAMTYLALVGLVVGFALTRSMARSVADPLGQVVEAMRRIESGELDTAVEVDHPSDLGRLQSGFNQMAAGLRERRLVEDLFGRHVGVDVAHAALERGIDLAGEARSATVMFVDLVGSTSFTATAPPAEVVAAANRLFAEVIEVTSTCGGWVNKFQGDGAMCVFGAPVDHPQHPERALEAARLLRDRLTAVNIDAAIGLASGEVVAGHVGTEARLEYTVMGATVNKAARLCELAKRYDGRILAALPGATRLLPPWRSVGELELRGFPAPVRAHTLDGGREIPTG